MLQAVSTSEHSRHLWKKPFVCMECEQDFSVKSHLIRCKRTHSREKLVVCRECWWWSFTQKSHFIRHQRACTEKKLSVSVSLAINCIMTSPGQMEPPQP